MVHTNFSRNAVIRSRDELAIAVNRLITRSHAAPDRFGIEVEGFPIVTGPSGPIGRLRLADGRPSVLGIVDELAGRGDIVLPRPAGITGHPTVSGGVISYEPGAQLEYSSSPLDSISDALDETVRTWEGLTDAFWSHGVCLLSLGVDPWSGAGEVPQQLTANRYQSMAKYLARRGGHGDVMMRNTCSLQVNLDQGGHRRNRRWLVSNLMSPALTAMFASSPVHGLHSARAQAWQRLDPTRTGFPEWSTTKDADLVCDTVRRALTADVMYIEREEHSILGRPGWSFGDWLEEGHPDAGAATIGDLETHLSTIFTEIRPRHGTLEFRGIDALPQRMWAAPLVITSSVIYNDAATEAVIDILSDWAPRLHQLWLQSATSGLGDPELFSGTTQLVEIAVTAANRDPSRFGLDAIAATERFVEQYTLRGTSPSDELATLLEDPRKALEWVVPQHSPVTR